MRASENRKKSATRREEASHGRTSSRRYTVIVVRGWTKEKLAERMVKHLESIPPEDIVSINYMSDNIVTLFWRRNSALITIRPVD